MKYKFNQSNYHQFNVIDVNKLDPRSYFIPYNTKEQVDNVALKEERYQSSKVVCVNGEWDFAFYHNPGDVPTFFDTDKITFDKLEVPSCWQYKGYDRPFYVNTRYQFPYNPPVIPSLEQVKKTFCWMGNDYPYMAMPRWQHPVDEYNFVGVYRTWLNIENLNKNHILSFLGVASCLDLYLNGSFVGYSEGAHNTAEFDISSILTKGKNELVAVVHRWCTGTYLECQDMFRNNGIFRDVLLREVETVDFWDIDFKTKKTKSGYSAIASAVLTAEGTVTFTLSGNGISKSVTVESNGKTAVAEFENLDVQEWNAEYPVLYDLYYEMEHSCIKKRIGFKTVTIVKDIFYINGRKIKLHGVNHHDSSSVNGFYMTPDEIEKDMQLCKEYNIDTVRTSHYAPDPLLLEYCNELGIYVVDEADLETHGVFAHKLPPSYNRISADPKWEAHYMDRIKRHYQRDKMYSCVIMWSLGNESGGGCNTDTMYEWLKTVTDIPVHYEGVIHSKRKAYDVGSQMYPSVKHVHEVGEKTSKIKELNDRPYFLCEYAHAMGVGPGAVEEYWKEIYSYDSLFGGCVWEMVDHAVLHPDGSYTYGGDHGEWEHDGNFCVDGIFYPDRTPSTGAKIIRFIYRPIRISFIENNTFQLFNTTAFSDGKRYRLEIALSNSRQFSIVPEVAPLKKVEIKLDLGELFPGVLMTVKTIDMVSGREVATEQLELQKYVTSPVKITKKLPENVAFENGKVTISAGNKKMSVSTPYTILFRAQTDNDQDALYVKFMRRFYVQKETMVSVDKQQDKVTVISRIECKKHIFTCTDVYQGCEGGLYVTSKLHCENGKGNVPRFGKAFKLDQAFDDVRYCGRNAESYADMKDQTQIEEVSCKVKDMTEPNIKPQESGNRCDCRWAAVSDGNSEILFKAVDSTFELGIKPYTDLELAKMKHREDEVRTGTYVTISAFQMGIGSGSCGPVTVEKYCYPVNQDYEVKFIISVT